MGQPLAGDGRPLRWPRRWLRGARLRGRLWVLPVLCVATLAASGALPPRALAGDAQAPQIIVGYHDLDLSTPAGARALLRRIESAARRVCITDAPDELEVLARVDECRKQAVARAVARVHAPALTAAYRARYGRAARGRA